MEARFYALNDLVRADCHDCHGCSSCCREMGDTILLDPYDAYQFQKQGKPMTGLLESGAAALTVWEGMILPHLQMNAATGACSFLSGDGRCGIHEFRPGMCRLFPLGRNFEDGKMNYFLLEHACENRNRSKIRVSRWLGIEPPEEYHRYVLEWHDFRHEMVDILSGAEEEQAKQLNLHLLRTFFLSPYDTASDFYPQFSERTARIADAFH
ncbi:MAG: YkgJ family cysteine cluster protein [Eubacterium sp.]|nr:YkgJ family cysteine cluster protein [Eubacterium sp.]